MFRVVPTIVHAPMLNSGRRRTRFGHMPSPTRWV